MSDRHFGLMGYVDLQLGQDLGPRVDSGLADAGFSRGASAGAYADASGRSVRCSWGGPTGSRWPDSLPAWAVFPIDYDTYEAYGAAVFVSVFRALCRATTPILARSFHPIGVDMIHQSELDGKVDYVDWIQYYGPRVAAAIGPDRIRAAGFHQLEEFPDGSVLAMAKAHYIDDFPNRKTIVDTLGLTPRSIFARNPKTGEPMKINWCR